MNNNQNIPKTRILIVEDEPKVSSFIKKGLETYLFEANIAENGLTGRDMADNEPYDLILLDINLPVLNGFDVCRLIRAINPAIPIIMLTARGTTVDIAKAQSCGADAYVVKPFEFNELVKIINTLLKINSSRNNEENIIRVADLEINKVTKTVKRGNKIINASKMEFELLHFFMINQGKEISVDEIGKIFDLSKDTAINQVHLYMTILQKKLDRESKIKFIHAVRDIAYLFNPS